jgi:hypothetical protein
MSTVIICYSHTGNNQALAASIAREMHADHVDVVEKRPRSMRTILLDMIFQRTPAVQPQPDVIDRYDRVILMGPVWMGVVATPLRVYMKYLKQHPCKYWFISISGGADGENPKIEGELVRRVGAKPEFIRDLHIADLLPANPKPERSVTSAYKLTENDVNKLTSSVTAAINGIS